MTGHQGARDMFAGHPALYLSSDLAAKVTGVTIPVDAGHLIVTPYNHAPSR